MDPAQAAEALANAVNADAGESVGEQAPAPQGDGDTGATPQGTPDEQLFESINPDELPEELQPLARQLLGDYTRKTQGIAEQRKAFEALGDVDPNLAKQAVEFYTAISTDPYAAKAAYDQLHGALEAGGFLSDDDGSGYEGHVEDEGYEEGDPEDERVRNLETRLEQFEREQEIMSNVNLLQRQEQAIREQHPEYQKEDVGRIYELAFAYGGDLLMAEQAYGQWRQGLISQYMNEKGSTPAGVAPTAPTRQAVQPREIKTLDQAHGAALEYLRNVLGE